MCLLAGLPFLPRSPRWLAKVGRVDEAIEILARIQAGGDVNDPLVVAEWEEITTILAAERGKRFLYFTVHAHPPFTAANRERRETFHPLS